MKTYWNTTGKLSHLTEWEPNCWIQVTCPTEDDQRELEERFNIPDYFISDISDTDERARYEYDDGWMLIILYHSQARRDHHRLLLRDQHDARLRVVPPEARRGLHR